MSRKGKSRKRRKSGKPAAANNADIQRNAEPNSVPGDKPDTKHGASHGGVVDNGSAERHGDVDTDQNHADKTDTCHNEEASVHDNDQLDADTDDEGIPEPHDEGVKESNNKVDIDTVSKTNGGAHSDDEKAGITDGAKTEKAGDSAEQNAASAAPVIEELNIKTAKPHKLPKWARISIIVAVVLAVVLAAVGVGVWSYERWGRITVSVNGVEQQVHSETTLGELMRNNDNFEAKPGRLLSLSGKVLKETGGKPVVYTLNGQKIKGDSSADKSDNAAAGEDENDDEADATEVPANLESIKLPANAKITVKSGKDVTEKHTAKRTMIPFNVVINGHGVIQKLRQVGKEGASEIWTGQTSGEKVDKNVVEKPQDLIVDTFSPKPANRKVIALTFDDGPSQYSGPILDILKQEGVKATFFDIGTGAAAYPQFEQRMVAEGHQVASHSNTHPDMKKLNPDQLRADITQGFANIKAASGVSTKMLRAPYGNFGADQWRYTNGLIDSNVIWTIDTKDWKMPGAPAISNAALSKAYNGAVILMHDGGGDRTEDIAALPGIIDGLKAQGYEFVTIDQLMAMNGQ